MFVIEKKFGNSLGRAGRLQTPHGIIETPAFAAVGTKATVKALTPEQIKGTGAQIVLGNTYHLYLEPGHETVRAASGLGSFMGWNGPTMTDSGGFQVFSLGAAFERKTSKIRRSYTSVLQNTSIASAEVKEREETREAEKELGPRLRLPAMPALAGQAGGNDTHTGKLVSIDEEGVTFTSHKDGSTHRFTPERSVEIQHAIGADIIFAFDECTSPEASYAYQKEAMERTHRWANRSLDAHRRLTQMEAQINADALHPRSSASYPRTSALFGIVQGGRFEDLRKESAHTIGKMEFDGFGIGGSFDKRDMDTAVRWVNELLPEEKPRHLLGIGEPEDLFGAIENGCDLFDCVAPTRNGRTGTLYTRDGKINITNSAFVRDFSPIEKTCGCYACRNFTRSYLCHLFRAKEMLAATLASIHNLHFIINLVHNIRRAILESRFNEFKTNFLSVYKTNGQYPTGR